MIIDNYCATFCPIRDTLKCRSIKDEKGKLGFANFWSPEDFRNFVKALFRNAKLVEAFVRPEALIPEVIKPQTRDR